MKVCISGATGFIGRHLLQLFEGLGPQLLVVKSKTTDISYLTTKFPDIQILNFNSDFFNTKGASKGTMSLPMKLFGSAKNIVIEITEEYLSETEEAALSVFLDQARENNNKIALDDFPSKQSNLNRKIGKRS